MSLRRFLLLSLVPVIIVAMTALSGSPTRPLAISALDSYPPLTNPSVNIAPNPNFLSSADNPCVEGSAWIVNSTTPACTNYLLSTINNARASEDVAPMVLPTNWYSLSLAEQLFVVVNLERVDRGYPPYLGLNADLNAAALAGAQAYTDPAPSPSFPAINDAQGYLGFGGAWAGGFSVLAADYIWFYDDGYSDTTTSNVDCTSATAPGCWSHRDELLGSDPNYNYGVGLGCTTCEVGAAYADTVAPAYVVLVELSATAPAMTFTWADELTHFTSTTTTSVATTTSPPVTSTTISVVSTTPTTSTTTPSRPAPIVPLAPPSTVTLARVTLSANHLQVIWAAPQARGVTSASLLGFRGPGCILRWRWSKQIYSAATERTSGTLSVTGRNYFAITRTYSIRVIVTNHAGSTRSSCRLLHR